ncbi:MULTISPECIES: efflux RND transporter periplasmic adaptor subunit [Methylobacterium]|uniref:Efflux RND transporter periplasmic adaptor subunit n=1 Tax=Methylobacterium longum TaxID=767694 RepID=A0ABT8AIK6_9HYPH|nr:MULTISPECIES: efflux RND transporter periplasmic adaptor subunit [Methylobacterium]MCJ2100982.1 efflux RND transporter periplasmic adaptor subunit [Methylobacterium sp. E-046]MDN3569204.1 efflux RND transporter periplasmic adaptor subunit [Methylobacterium longum]GJE10613.1 Multidrug resistance protein MdtA [Methylobacterium longum]
MKAHDAGEDIPPPPGKAPFLLVGLVGIGLLAWGGYGHWRRDAEATATLEQTKSLIPQVRTVVAERAAGPLDLVLPGEMQAFTTASIAARATGYIAERRVDIGSRVKAGDLLLRIAAPDLDQQLAQAEAQVGQLKAQLLQAQAQVEQARANVNLANLTNNRTTTLAVQGWASRQNADNAQAGVLSQAATLAAAEAGVKVATANIRTQEAAVERLRALTAFERVVAPFDGVVTTRNVDVGDLVRADNGGTPLLSIDQDSILRITVNVPQNDAVGVKPGVEAVITVPQLPGRSFDGFVERSSVALNAASRTLTTQVDVPNPDRILRAGLYAYVTLKIPRGAPSVSVPAEATVFNTQGLQVAEVGGDDRVTWRTVRVRRDLGRTLELESGLSADSHIIYSPPPDLRDGQAIERVTPATGAPAIRSAQR